MSFTPSAEIRASHTIRIFGTNKDDEVLQDIWLDIERIDMFATKEQIDGHWQAVLHRLHWMDDPAAEGYSGRGGNPARLRGTLQICSPDEADQEDPDEWVPVAINVAMRFKESTDYGQQAGVRINRTYAENEARRVAARRIWHRDTTIDAKVDAATAADPALRVYVVASDQYEFVEGGDDKDTYIEVQFMSQTARQVGVDSRTGAGNDQTAGFNLRNKFLLDISEEAQGPVNPVHGFDPPWALDPYQAIVNCKFGAKEQQWLLGMLPSQYVSGDYLRDRSSASGKSKDGRAWPNALAGASGFGFTATTSQFVAFGNLTIVIDGAEVKKPHFARASDETGDVDLGVLNEGAIVWSNVKNFPDGIRALSFANDRLFVSYLVAAGDDGDNSRLAMSSNGVDFSMGINPFPTAPSEFINGRNNWGGNVVWNKKTEKYGCAGSCWFKGTSEEDEALCFSLLTAVSSNGTSWTDKIHDGVSGYTGIGSQFDIQQSTIAAGNGVFVASASVKHRSVQFPGFPDAAPDYVAMSCGVAVSSNGTTWTLIELPGARFINNESSSEGNLNGDTLAVAFIKDKRFKNPANPDLEGYFIAAGVERTNIPSMGGPTSWGKLWQSTNGSSWTAIEQSDAGKEYVSLSAINEKIPPDANIIAF